MKIKHYFSSKHSQVPILRTCLINVTSHIFPIHITIFYLTNKKSPTFPFSLPNKFQEMSQRYVSQEAQSIYYQVFFVTLSKAVFFIMGFNSIGEGFVLNKSHIDTCARLLLLPQTKFSHSNLCHVPRLGFLFSFSTFMLLNPVKLCKFYHTYLFKSYLRTIDLCNGRFLLKFQFSFEHLMFCTTSSISRKYSKYVLCFQLRLCTEAGLKTIFILKVSCCLYQKFQFKDLSKI